MKFCPTIIIYQDSKEINLCNVEEHLKQLNEGLALKENSQSRSGLPSKDKKDIFSCRARINFELGHYEEALKDFLVYYKECDEVYDLSDFDNCQHPPYKHPTPKAGLKDNVAFVDNAHYLKLLPEFYQCLEHFRLYDESLPYLVTAFNSRTEMLIYLDENVEENMKIWHKTKLLMAAMVGKMCYKLDEYWESWDTLHSYHQIYSIDTDDIEKAEWLGDETFHYLQKFKAYYVGLSKMKMARFFRGNDQRVKHYRRAIAIFEMIANQEAASDETIDDLYIKLMQYYHQLTCHYQLGDYAKMDQILQKCEQKIEEVTNHKDFSKLLRRNSLFSLNFEFTDELHIIRIALKSKSPEKSKNIESMKNPLPSYGKMIKVFQNLDHPYYVPLYVNEISCNYSSDRNLKKKWRLFKNSALIINEIRDKFKSERIKTCTIVIE